MLSCRGWALAVLAGTIVSACGGSSATLSPGDDGGTGAGSDSSSGGGDATVNDGPPGSESGANTEAAADVGSGSDSPTAMDSAPASDAGDDGANGGGDDGGGTDSASAPDASDAAAPPCPDVSGAYSINVVEGQGCGTLNASAPQCIRQGTPGVCDILFQSVVTRGAPAINGDPTLENDGSFTNGALREGTLPRTGCTGTWDGSTSTMTVDCGGTGSTQACVLALRRTGSRCN
jgi:hypothetical protein